MFELFRFRIKIWIKSNILRLCARRQTVLSFFFLCLLVDVQPNTSKSKVQKNKIVDMSVQTLLLSCRHALLLFLLLALLCFVVLQSPDSAALNKHVGCSE